MRKVIVGGFAVAETVALCQPKVVAAYPITPQTYMVEKLADIVNDGKLDASYISVESEFSAISAVLGASATGVRTYSATSSQGLALMNEVLFTVSGMRLPVVMNVANRALASPINIWNDQQDVMSERDAGWIQLFSENVQEACDLTVMAYKIAENSNVMLPAMVNLDGYILSHVYEPVEFLSQEQVDSFLPKFAPTNYLDSKNPMTFGPIGFPNAYMELRAAQNDALMSADAVIAKTMSDFSREFGREYKQVEYYKADDADYVFLAMGSVCGTVKDVIDELRAKGEKVGLVSLRQFRPLPKLNIKASKVGVLDKSVSIGMGSPLASEVKTRLYGSGIDVESYIIGLGGRDVTKKHVTDALEKLKIGESAWMF